MSTGIDESFDRDAVDLAVDVEHDDGAEALRVVLHGQLHVVLDVLVLDLLRDQSLSLDVHWIGRQQPDSKPLPFRPSSLLLPQDLLIEQI